MNQIFYICRKDLDGQKWDRCIEGATNGLIYAQVAYLDAMSVHWDALILGDYQAVMPLTWNRKYGIYYLYQPFLCASLGIFGNGLNAGIVQDFLTAIPARFRYCDIYLNSGNNFTIQGFDVYPRLNFVLSLNKPYDLLSGRFRNSYKQILRRFEKLGNRVSKEVPVDEVIALAKEQLNPLFNVKTSDYLNFASLFNWLKADGKAESYGVYDKKGQLLASGLFLFSNQRAYYVLAGNHPDGRTIGASHAMLDAFIRQYSGSDLVLDFEGSDVSRIAFFFKGFGASELYYPGLKYNRLPRLLRWIKN
ncbi:MAG: GNAT family N-acetyltransferase [Chitinophagaceae bacterium]